MKILILLLAVVLFSCSNNSKQRKIYEDSAKMFVDSFVKYKAGPILNDSAELVRKNRFFLYHTMYEYYKKKAEELK